MTPCGADTKWFESCNAFVLDNPIACVVSFFFTLNMVTFGYVCWA